MKNKFTLGILCVALLMCSLPVSAATNNGCPHHYVSYSEPQSTKYKDNTHHALIYEQGKRCTECFAKLEGSVTKVEILEIHSPSGTYTDLGHSGTYIHRFNVKCSKCEEYYILSIACDGNDTGFHVHL